MNNIEQFKIQVMKGLVCPYCGQPTELVDSAIIYNGKSYGLIYLCKPCKAYVGVHKGTTEALGRLANAELREAKKLAHHYFDQIAKTSLINTIWPEFLPKTSNRGKAYKWLAKQLNIDPRDCHIGMFDVDDCMRVVEVCKPVIPQV